MSDATPQEVTFLIIGAGFSGLGAAIRLTTAGYRDLVVLERAGEVGGTWRDNVYPGCRCDVPSNLYSYSFEAKADWRETFPSQPELWEYLQQIVRKYQLGSYLRFGHEVTSARWDIADRDGGRWLVTTGQGTFAAYGGATGRTYDISGDDRRFLMLKDGPRDAPEQSARARLVVIEGWLDQLRTRVPQR